jgi:hypothetical protein
MLYLKDRFRLGSRAELALLLRTAGGVAAASILPDMLVGRLHGVGREDWAPLSNRIAATLIK